MKMRITLAAAAAMLLWQGSGIAAEAVEPEMPSAQTFEVTAVAAVPEMQPIAEVKAVPAVKPMAEIKAVAEVPGVASVK